MSLRFFTTTIESYADHGNYSISKTSDGRWACSYAPKDTSNLLIIVIVIGNVESIVEAQKLINEHNDNNSVV